MFLRAYVYMCVRDRVTMGKRSFQGGESESRGIDSCMVYLLDSAC
jgi:hypothetical protein